MINFVSKGEPDNIHMSSDIELVNTLPNGYTLNGVYFCSAAKNGDWIKLRVDAKKIVVPSLLLDSIARFLMHKQNMTFEKQSDGTITIFIPVI